MSRENLLILGASFLIAIGVRLALAPEFAPGKEREFEAKLEYHGLPDSLMLVGEPKMFKVIASGSKDYLDHLDTNAVVASVDLSIAKPGVRLYSVDVPLMVSRVNLAPKFPTLRLDIQPVDSMEQHVEIEPTGLPPSDLVYDGASIIPEVVTIVGAKSRLATVRRARVLLDLSQVRPGVSKNIPVEIFDESDRPVPYVKAQPSEVSVSPAVAAAPAEKRVLVTPTWVGQPAFGYKVTSYEIRPSQILVRGESAIMSRIGTVDTEPVTLNGLSESTTVSTRIKLPLGVKSTTPLDVKVIIKIAPTNGQGTNGN